MGNVINFPSSKKEIPKEIQKKADAIMAKVTFFNKLILTFRSAKKYNRLDEAVKLFRKHFKSRGWTDESIESYVVAAKERI